MDDAALIEYLKGQGLYDALRDAAGIAKDATVDDVHQPAAGGNEPPKRKKPPEPEPEPEMVAKGDGGFELVIDVRKTEPDKQMIFGWASVCTVDGKAIVDKQGDVIMPEDLEPAAYEFVLYSRTHGEMHESIGTGRMVESCMFTPEKAAAGITAKNEKGEALTGWWVGFLVQDEATWARAKGGELPEFSIGGRAARVEA